MAKSRNSCNHTKDHEILKPVLDQLNGFVYTYDVSGTITYCTRRCAEVVGYRREEIIGKSLLDFVPEREKEKVQRAIEDRVKDGVVQSYEVILIDRYRRERNYQINASPLVLNSVTVGGIVVGEDVSEKNEAVKAMTDSEARYRELFETSLDGIAIFGTNGRCLDCNQAFLELLGHSVKASVIDQSYKKITPPEYHDQDFKAMRQILERGYCDEYEKEYVRTDGTRVVTSVRGWARVDDNNQPIGGWFLVHDTTDRKRVEQELRHSEERYRTIFENTGTAMLIINEDTTVIRVNKETERLTGFPRNKEGTMKWTEFVLPEDLERMLNYHKARRGFGNTVPRNYEFRLVRKDGEIREVSLIAAMIPGSTQSIISLMDITEAKWAARRLRASNEELEATLEELTAIEEELRQQYQELQNQKAALTESERRFRSLLEEVKLLAIIVDAGGTITFANNFLLELTGWQREELEGQNFRTLFPSSIREKMARLFEKTIQRERIINFGPSYLQTKNGQDRRIYWNNTLLLDTDQNVVGLATIGEDITERWRAEKELKKSVAEMRHLLSGAVEALAATAEKRDPYTAGHQRRVAALACAIAKKMGLNVNRIDALRIASILHDIGKMYIPTEILSKPGRLTEVEMLLVRTHCQAGSDIVKKIPFYEPIAQFLLQHHERLDGSGYPQGLKGPEILLEARILGVADVVEAMASHRPYRPALGVTKALEEITANSGILYDPEVVKACCQLFTEEGFEFADI